MATRDCHCHLPSTSEEARGVCVEQGDCVQKAWSTRSSTRPQHCVRNAYRDVGPNSPVPEADQRHPIPKGVGLELVTVAQAVAATTCRKSVAPRRQGSRVPSPRTQVASRVPPFAGRFLGRRPFVSLGRFLGRRHFVRSTIARCRRSH